MKKIKDRVGYLFISPFFLVFFLFNAYPIFFTLYLSMTRYKGYGPKLFIGAENFMLIFKDPNVVDAFMNTIKIWGVNIVFQVFLALLLVMVFSDIKYKVKGLGFFRVIFYLPNLIAAATIALVFVKLLDKDYGVLNQFLFSIGWINESIGWLTKPILAQMSVSGIQTWMWFGNSFILFMASVQAVSKETYEAAAIDGAGRFQVLKNITLPSIKPILMYVMITGLIGGLQLFDIPFLITDGRGFPEGSLNTMIVYIYNMAFVYKNYGYASALSFALFILIMTFTVVFTVMTNRNEIREFLERRKVNKERKKKLMSSKGSANNE
ncbi:MULTISPECIES: carbohydrate ABC transporter permease [unclassified Fusibacter]|uniref:carbohydrate ABC transporter permease n=1 Tax=unclassified Fusibacter TaxID=2624464 RepID=UPI0019D6DDF9|nr:MULTISPECIES: sugar ABC transporter permease [unclassified Fusibacter]MCK8061289.1 sugar ABC transporter permease [Fusibacter sp. A2]